VNGNEKMVLAHLAAFLVDKFLGNYIEGFDTDQLKISLCNGSTFSSRYSLKLPLILFR
jgi:hypothetical protein